MRTLILIALFVSSSALAAGKGTGTVMDLKWPAVNFFFLFGFLIWKLKKPLSEMFDKNAADVSQLYEVAEEKSKEAQIKFDMYQKKMSQVTGDYQRVIDESLADADLFAQRKKEEMDGLISKLEKDSEDKLEFEKKTMVRELEMSLVDTVISKAKNTISSDKITQRKITDKLVSQLK